MTAEEQENVQRLENEYRQQYEQSVQMNNIKQQAEELFKKNVGKFSRWNENRINIVVNKRELNNKMSVIYFYSMYPVCSHPNVKGVETS